MVGIIVPMSAVNLSQLPIELHLFCKKGDAVNLTHTVANTNWSGTYVASINVNGTPVALTVTATFDTPDTDFAFTMSAVVSAGIPVGRWPFTAKVGDTTRFSGLVFVQ